MEKSNVNYCAKCQKAIKTREWLCCSACKKTYDIFCAQVSGTRFYMMEKLRKESWKCGPCYERKAVAVKQPYIGTPSKNVTLRKKQHIEIPVNPLTPHRSLDDEEELSSIEDSDLASLPDLSTHQTDREHEHIMQENSDLKLELMKAHNEIDNLNSENSELKKQILEKDTCIVKWKRLFTEAMITPKRRNSLIRRDSCEKKTLKFSNAQSFEMEGTNETTNRDNSYAQLLQIENNERGAKANHKKVKDVEMATQKKKQSTLQTEHKGELKQNKTVEAKYIHTNIRAANEKMKTVENKHNTLAEKSDLEANGNKLSRRVYIFGGKQCVGLSKDLTESRQGSPYELYQVTAFTKPHSTSEDICNTVKLYTINEDDKIILSVGEHDENLGDLRRALETFLGSTKSRKIILLSVGRNKYFKEITLNDNLKSISMKYPNCTFLNISKELNNVNERIKISKICKRINLEIDQTDYDTKFLNIKNVKKLIFRNRKVEAGCIKKGTIEYYFQKMKKVEGNKKQVIVEDKATRPSKGTITAYFPVIDKQETTKFFRV